MVCVLVIGLLLFDGGVGGGRVGGLGLGLKIDNILF